MDDLRRLEAKGLARAKIRSQRRRVSLIRRRTIRGSVALFALFWAVIFGQLISGNDPALSRAKAAHERLATTRAKQGSTPASAGATPSTAPPEPEPEAQLERELERERELEPGVEEGEPQSETEVQPEIEPAPEAAVAPEPAPAPAPSPPIVTSSS